MLTHKPCFLPFFWQKHYFGDSVSPNVRTKIPVISLIHSTSGDNDRLFSDGSNFISISGCIFYKHRPMCFIFFSYLFTHSVNTCIHRATWTFLEEHMEHFAHVNTTVDASGAFFLRWQISYHSEALCYYLFPSKNVPCSASASWFPQPPFSPQDIQASRASNL